MDIDRNRKLILIGACALGLISGPSALASAEASEPPIVWEDILFIVIGALLSVLFVLLFQLTHNNPKPAHFVIRLFKVVTVYFLGTGIAALAFSIAKNGLVAPGFVFIAIGVGAIAGVGLASIAYKARYRNNGDTILN